MQPLGEGGQLCEQCIAPSLVAAFDQGHLKTDGAQNRGQRTAAVAAPPAVDQWLPALGFVDHLTFDVCGNIAGGQRSPPLFGLERVDLLVERADLDTLVVVQRGPVDGARQVVFGKFGFRARVDNSVETAQAVGHRMGR